MVVGRSRIRSHVWSYYKIFFLNIETSSDQPVFQYYTIVNDASTVLTLNQDNNQEEEDGSRSVLYVTFQQEDSQETSLKEEDEQEEEIESENPSFLSDLKLIALDDGRMFVTTSANGDCKLVHSLVVLILPLIL